MVVRLDLEGDRPAIANRDHARVLARSLEHVWGRSWEAAEQGTGVLVRAVLRPQGGDDAELGERRIAAEHADDALVFVRRDTMLGDERRRDDRITGTGLDRHQCGAAAVSFFGTMCW